MMTPKKAVIIILILFLLTAVGFTVSYYLARLGVSGQTGAQSGEISNPAADQGIAPVKSSAAAEDKVKEIINQAELNPAQSDPDQVRADIIEAINEEITKEEAKKTAEEKEAEEKALERQKAIDQINSQIKQGMNN